MSTYNRLYKPTSQIQNKLASFIGKKLLSKEDKENHSPNKKKKQNSFHFSKNKVTLKTLTHLTKHVKKGGKHKKTQKRNRSKSKRYMKS